MLQGIYSAAAGMAAQQAAMDALSNDIANVNTVGYHRIRVDFRDLVYGDQGGIAVGSGAQSVTLGVTQAQGTLLPSQNPLALAIQGPGYFQVKRADGSVALTRSGDLQLDGAGALVLASGERVEPAITVAKGTSPSDIAVAPDGRVVAGGKEIGKITLVDVPAPSGLIALGGGLLAPTAQSGAPAPTTAATLTQGSVEASNVNLADAMVGVIEAERGFQFASRALRTQDQLMEIVNAIRR